MDKIISKKILAIDDNEDILGHLSILLRNEGEVITASTVQDGLLKISENKIDVAIVDLNFEGDEKDGLFLLEEISKKHPNVPLIVLSGDTLTSRVVNATRYRLIEFIAKDQDFQKTLVRAVQKALSVRVKNVFESELPIFETRSPAMRVVLNEVSRITKADLQCPILITGETGTGKEIMAKHIAYLLKKQMVTANMAAIPQELAEAELFGAVEGAYTGAGKGREGLIQKAQNGIFFLDEVGDCSLKVQASLLRTIQENEVKAVGSTSTKTLRVRFLAATNKDLKQMAFEKTFRDDLLERLNTFQIRLLPLRERPEDIIYYTEKFLNLNSPEKQFFISPSGEATLLNHHWPGNVRELMNVVRRIIALSDKTTIDDAVVRAAIGNLEVPLELTLSSKQRTPKSDELLRTLVRMKGNRAQTAAFFGVHKVTLVRWLKAFGLESKIPGRAGRPRVLPQINSARPVI